MNGPGHAVLRDPLLPFVPSGAIGHSRVARHRGRIARLRRLNHDTFELVIACAPGATPLVVRAGQYAMLSFPGIGRPRAYSFARDPHTEHPGEHTFHIRLVPGGEVSAWLAARDRGGEPVGLAGPLGTFGLDDGTAPMLMVAGGSGLSAIKALLEAACRLQLARDCVVLHGVRTRADRYAGETMSRIAARWHPAHRFEFVEVLSEEPAGPAWTGARGLVGDVVRDVWLTSGRLDAGALRAWVCGPPPMIEATSAALHAAGTPRKHIHYDSFADVRSPAPAIDNRKCVLCDECLLVRPVADCIVEAGQLGADAAGRLVDFVPLRPARDAGLYYNALVVDAEACVRCYACVAACPHDAISPEHEARAVSLRRYAMR